MKILKFLSLFFVFLFLPFVASPALAEPTCPSITTSPSPVTTNETYVNVIINTQSITPTNTTGEPYTIKFDGSSVAEPYAFSSKTFDVSNNTITIQNLNWNGLLRPGGGRNFKEGTYTLSVYNKSGGDPLCSASFTVQPTTTASGGNCKITFDNPLDKFTVDDEINIKVSDLGGYPPDGRRIVIKKNDQNQNDYRTFNTNVGQLTSGVDIGKFDAGIYYMEIRSGQDFLANRDCYTNFGIGQKGQGLVGEFATPSPDCTEGLEVDLKTVTTERSKIVKCTKVATAFGIIISADPVEFVKTLFGILLSLAGGIAIVLIIIAGYRLMFSEGNPEKAQAAREQLTSAIVGLLFIIFSMTILTVIGVDILHIPGLTK